MLIGEESERRERKSTVKFNSHPCKKIGTQKNEITVIHSYFRESQKEKQEPCKWFLLFL
jgi:hypothetical protein